ncbi:MAG: capsid protein [Clostridiales bacterium]|jgi:hypothetical protein|nr:capsid protein [Clostridiales bacterium]
MGWFLDKIRGLAGIGGAAEEYVSIQPARGFETAALEKTVWYRGQPGELAQFYSQTDDWAGNTSFWAASARSGSKVRRIHSGLPALIADTLAGIAASDFLGVTVDRAQDIWDEIARENNFAGLIKKAARAALVVGDGAFKLSYDGAVSRFPIIEFFGGDRTRYEYSRGRLESVVFTTEYERGGKRWRLHERYRRGGVDYRLADESGREVPLSSLEETASLRPVVNEEGFMMAFPLIFDESAAYPGRGKSVYEGKLGAFDALDETLSQWVDALRDGRVVTYIPSNMLPRDPATGEALRPDGFSRRYAETDADLSEGGGHITVAQPEIKTDALFSTYANFLDIALTGVIAPATLGIDVKKLDNAEAQREKEKATLYTRGRIVSALSAVLPEVADAALRMYSAINGADERGRFAAAARFGEYQNPSFEAQIEAVGKAVSGGIMSVRTAVSELYGSTWTAEMKEEEIARLESDTNLR